MKTQHIGTYAFTGNMPSVAQYTGRLWQVIVINLNYGVLNEII
jgi:hypothetical protein